MNILFDCRISLVTCIFAITLVFRYTIHVCNKNVDIKYMLMFEGLYFNACVHEEEIS